MGCNIIKDEYGRTVAVVCTRDNKASKEWEEMCKELEKSTQAKEKIDKKVMVVEFDEDEVLQIVEDYYGDQEEEFSLDAWTEEEIKCAILNR